ncbi:hypothetical protein HPB48_022502 [Haemaphysalis longicornis]|uniref:Uncharacterized protein n=1 Tax=Haemaphysalis longicornis TaxID=44386 RepID=A0A9J6GTR4_HAELO|nr:hypothetical protein HPB48_022502 [Haemaphysalis longicornis]
MAIVLALLDPQHNVIYSDSRSAIRTFGRGVVDSKDSKLLEGKNISFIVWFPAHNGDLGGELRNLKESAREAARGLISRAPSQPPTSPHRAFNDQL